MESVSFAIVRQANHRRLHPLKLRDIFQRIRKLSAIRELQVQALPRYFSQSRRTAWNSFSIAFFKISPASISELAL